MILGKSDTVQITIRDTKDCFYLCEVPPSGLTNAGKSGSTLTEEFWEGHLDGVAGTPGFPLERRVSLMLVTVLISAMGVNRTLLRRLPGGWAFVLAFRREMFASLDVATTAPTLLPPSRRCRVNGALLDELPLVTGLAPLLQTKLRAEPCETLYATDASPSGAGGCSASITSTTWPRRKESTFASIGKAMNHRATCIMCVQLLRRLL